MSRKATPSQISQALKALGLESCPVMQATVEDDGTLILYLVPNPEPVTYKPSKPSRKRTTTTKKSGD